MTTEELAELFLVHLYDLAEAAPHPNFLFSVNDFVPMYGLSDKGELEKAMNLLSDKGLIILAGLDLLGGISAGITMDGSVFVERGGETGVIERYRKNPLTFVAPRSETPAPSPVPEEEIQTVREEKQGAPYAGRALVAILADIEEILGGDGSVPIETRKDLLSDLATIRIQLARSVKNRAVIQAMLDDLSGIPSIAPLVTALNCIFGAYFK